MSMLTKRKAPAKLAAPFVKRNAKTTTKNTIDETRTSVSGTDAPQISKMETIEISSDADSDEDLSDDNEDENEAAAQQQSNDDIKAAQKGAEEEEEEEEQEAQVNGSSRGAENTQSDEEPTSPSFGELLRGNNETIDLAVMLRQPSAANSDGAAAAAVANRTERTAIVPPSHQSLATVLSQALSTDDTDLLESCLHTTDLPTIRNTIERLDSSLAGVLLHKLAARLHRRPGRAGTLMTWVQWTLVAHGGALASQAKVVHSLSSLQKVLADRAKALTSLLALKGKLDILEGQMELRRKMQKSIDQGNSNRIALKEEELERDDDDDDDDDEGEDVLYIEGEEQQQQTLANGLAPKRKLIQDADDALLANGFANDSEGEEEDSDDDVVEEEDGDDGDAEDLDDDEVNYDDVDESMGEDEESDVEAAPPAKVQKVNKSFNKKK